MISLSLPLPPSVNQIWRSGRRHVYKSKRYATWITTAGWELVLQKPKRFAGQVVVTISAGKPDGRRRDIDGIPKAVLDLLQSCQVVTDDSLVTSLTTRWDNTVAPGRAIVIIKPVLADVEPG